MNIQIGKEITVVIPALNEEERIPLLLHDLSLQTGCFGLQVFVADGGSRDSTIQIVNSLSKTYRHLRIQLIPGGSVSRGRNAGLALTITPCIVFIDADVRLHNHDTLQKTYEYLNRAQLVGSHLKTRSGIRAQFAYALFNLGNSILARYRPFAVGSFYATWTQRIREYGGFREDLVHSEDWVASAHYTPDEYRILPLSHSITVDDRRFQRTGYLGMAKMLYKSLTQGISYMKSDNGYWDHHNI